jgi:hypothetical protein
MYNGAIKAIKKYKNALRRYKPFERAEISGLVIRQKQEKRCK